MKQIMIWMILAVGLSVGACHQTTVGYLLTENASYDPDTMYIREEAAAIFKKDLTIRGGGVLLYPLENDAKPGVYKVSVRLTNPGYSHVLRDAMTIIVE